MHIFSGLKLFCFFNLHHFSTPLLFSVRYYRAKFSLTPKKFTGFTFLFSRYFYACCRVLFIFYCKIHSSSAAYSFFAGTTSKILHFWPRGGVYFALTYKNQPSQHRVFILHHFFTPLLTIFSIRLSFCVCIFISFIRILYIVYSVIKVLFLLFFAVNFSHKTAILLFPAATLCSGHDNRSIHSPLRLFK